MAIPIIPSLLRENLGALAADNQRLDGRERFAGRDLEIEIDCLMNAEGSCRVRMGDTIVLAGVVELYKEKTERPIQTPNHLVDTWDAHTTTVARLPYNLPSCVLELVVLRFIC